jgi:hypothetical protein
VTIIEQLQRTARENAETIELPEATRHRRALEAKGVREPEELSQIAPPDPRELVLLAWLRANEQAPPRLRLLARLHLSGRDMKLIGIGAGACALLFALIYFIGR